MTENTTKIIHDLVSDLGLKAEFDTKNKEAVVYDARGRRLAHYDKLEEGCAWAYGYRSAAQAFKAISPVSR